MPLIDASSYYEEFHGHDCEQLADVLNTLRAHKKSIVFFAGDSSLDNKEWVKEEASALNGYEHALHPAMIKMDVCYWVNRTLKERMPGVAALNTAAEESTVMQRVAGLFSDGQLTSQDGFIRNNITENGYLVVSVGGNDIALEPSMATVANTVALTRIACDEAIEDGFAMFGDHVQEYVEALVAERKPKRILICMIYFPDEAGQGQGGWADMALSTLGYNENPARLQAIIRKVFDEATSEIEVEGTEVVPVPLYTVLDGRDTADYAERVEPSMAGGRKMAKLLVDNLMQIMA